MDESKKQIVYIVIIVAALAVAGGITFITTGPGSASGPGTIPKDKMTWVICENCGETYEMQLREYYVQVEENMEPMMLTAPPLECKECGEEALYRAAKCEKCGHIFKRGTVPNDFADRCPKCGHSNTEAARKRHAQKNK